MPVHAEPVVDYVLRASLDPTLHTVHGEGTLKWKNTSSKPQSEVWLHLYLNAFKNQKSVFLREPVGRGARGSTPVKDWGYIDVRRFVLRETQGAPEDLWPTASLRREGDEDETDARVPLPRAVWPGEVVTFEMEWDDKLPSVVERTGYDGSLHFVAQWFPKIARLEPDGTWAHFPFHHLAEFYADFGSYDVTLDVPVGFSIGATGPLVESRVGSERYSERHVQGDIHDFAWTAWDKWERLDEAIAGVKVTLLHPPGYRSDAHRELAALRFAIPHFNERYGRYPYSVLTVVHPPDTVREAGGMEYPTLITTGGPWWGPPFVLSEEHVTVHEYGHQYFYGLLATNEVKWPFLDEGLNSFAEEIALGAWRGPGSVVDIAGLKVADESLQAVLSNRRVFNEAVAQPAYAFVSGSDYSGLVYQRTAAVMETVRRVYGDEPVKRAMGRYARRWRFRHPGPEDFLASFAEVLGPEVAETMRTAFFDKGWVDYVLSGLHSTKASQPLGVFDRDGKRETVKEPGERGTYEGWVLVTRRGTLAFPVDVELTFADGTIHRARWDGRGETVRLPFSGPSALTSAVVDPEHTVIIDQKLLNNFASTEDAPSQGAPRTMERATYWAELFLQGIAP
jgi:hypothetical protein